MKHFLVIAPLALLAACNSQPAPDPVPADDSADALPVPPVEPSAPAPETAAADPNILRLEGLGDLSIGQAVPSGSSWAVRGAQASDACLVLASPDYPGAYAIVEGDKVRRISIGKRSTVKLVEGIGPGATEAEVKKYFHYSTQPHKYVDAPGK